MKKCVSCGELIDDNAQFCLFCGATQPKPEKKKKKQSPSGNDNQSAGNSQKSDTSSQQQKPKRRTIEVEEQRKPAVSKKTDSSVKSKESSVQQAKPKRQVQESESVKQQAAPKKSKPLLRIDEYEEDADDSETEDKEDVAPAKKSRIPVKKKAVEEPVSDNDSSYDDEDDMAEEAEGYDEDTDNTDADYDTDDEDAATDEGSEITDTDDEEDEPDEQEDKSVKQKKEKHSLLGAKKKSAAKPKKSLRTRQQPKVAVPDSVDSHPEVMAAVQRENYIKQQKQDINDQKRELQEEKQNLEYVAYHDELTGLQNRKAYDKALKDLSKKELCVVAVDANGLKHTNDTYGHKYGDMLLTSVSSSLAGAFGEENCFRTGGDEFMVLLDGENKGLVDPKIKKFKELLKSKGEDVKRKEGLEENEMFTAAAGAAYGEEADSMQELLDLADSRMYEDKKEHKKQNLYFPDGTYNANWDGYYDDVEAKQDEYKKEFTKSVMKKVVFLIIGCIAVYILYVMFLQ